VPAPLAQISQQEFKRIKDQLEIAEAEASNWL